MIGFVTEPIYNRMKVWGDTLLNAEVREKLQMIAIAITLSAFLSFLSYSYEGAKIARAFVESFPLRLALGILIAGLPMATLTILIDTYLVSTSKRRGQSSWKALVARGVLIFMNSYFVSKGLVDLVTAVDRAHIVARDEAEKINNIRRTATNEARATAATEITAIQNRTGSAVERDLERCEREKAAKQVEINTVNDQMEDERRTGTRRNWHDLEAGIIRLRGELAALQVRCDTLSAQARGGTEAAIATRNAALEAEINRIVAMTPAQLAARYPALWQQSRGFIRDEKALQQLKTEEKWLASFLFGLQLFFLMVEFYPAFKKVFSGIVFEMYFTVEDQAKAGNAEAIKLLEVEGHTNIDLATMVPAARSAYDDHEAALQMFEKALGNHIALLIYLATYQDEQGYHLGIEFIQGRLRANWMQFVEAHRVETQRFRDKGETVQPPVASIFNMLDGNNPWDPEFNAWKVNAVYLAKHGWESPEARRENLKDVLEVIGTARDRLTRLLAHHRAILLKRVTLIGKDEKLDVGVILRERADAWVSEVLPLLADLETLEAEAGKAAPRWDDPRPGLEARFCTPYMEIQQICRSIGRDFTPPPGLAMAGPNDPNQPRACPRCGEANVGLPHCMTCGFTYWVAASKAVTDNGKPLPVPSRLLSTVAAAPPPPRSTITATNRLPPIPPKAQRPGTPPPVGGFDLDGMDDEKTGKHQVPPPPRQPPPPPRDAKTLQGQGPQPHVT